MNRFPVYMALIALLAGCGGAEITIADLTTDLWSAEGGPETFLFDFDAPREGHGGVVHAMADGRKRSEVPIVSLDLAGDRIEFAMSTGVLYRGRVDLDGGTISGGIVGPDGSLFEMDLTRTTAAAVPGLTARPAAAPPYVWTAPPALPDGWPTVSPGESGLSRAGVEGMVAAIEDGEAGVLHALLVVERGRLAVEEYFHGYDRDALHGIASCTKSVSSLLVGLARDRGLIGDLDAPLLDYFPDHAPVAAGWERITLRHLLTMSMGLDWSDEEAVNLHGAGPELFELVLARAPAREPGSAWRYVNANVNLLAGVIHRATGLHADAFARETLFAPLGIDRYNWDYLADQGYRSMDGSLQLRPRDMARLGQLVLDDGAWEGRRIVSAEWIAESTEPRIATDDPQFDYGYLWWHTRMPVADGDVEVVFASGWGSQFIVVVPERELVIVTTGGNQDNGKNFAAAKLISRHLLGRE